MPSTSQSRPAGRTRRELRLDTAVQYAVETDDNVEIRLTRYRGGPRGPVVLLHGLGVSSQIFSTDTIDTNLTEYLVEHGFDVWLLDCRVSVDLPAARLQSTADDVALRDLPLAIARVRSITRADRVDAVVHCFGATACFMALLAGLQGVRSVLCSQIATHIVPAAATRRKAALRLPDLLNRLGLDGVSARPTDGPVAAGRWLDRLLPFYPLPVDARCADPICRRISFMYSPLYRHEQLSPATHDSLDELFGMANLRTFIHLAHMTRLGRVVDASGGDAYMPHMSRLAIPITFIHGELNECYLPDSTARTMDALVAANGHELYDRFVLPGYGHIDCIFGQNAVRDVYPIVLRHLERAAT